MAKRIDGMPHQRRYDRDKNEVLEANRASARDRARNLRADKYELVKQRQREDYLKYPERYNEANRRKRSKRKDLINKIKIESGCIDCGFNNPIALDFDHRDPTEKLFSIGSHSHCKLEILMIEIAKCDIRCANCHRIKTYRNKDGFRGQTR